MTQRMAGREFTKRDWEALHFAYRLMEEVAMRGAPALETFLAAMRRRDNEAG